MTAPMLATLTDRYFSDPDWVFERKLDGERVIGTRSGRTATLRSRTGRILDGTYPELVRALRRQRGNFVVDGEVVAFAGNRTSFERLQQRIGLTDPVRAEASGVPVHFYLFDLLSLAGEDLTGLPLRERKRRLRAAIGFGGPLRYTAHRNTEGEELFAEACRRGWEGVIAKRADAPYRSGRSSDWLKFKCVGEQEFVIGGFTDPTGSRHGFGALLVGVYDGGELRFAGKVGTGFDHQTLTRLRSRMDALATASSPFHGAVRERGAHWVRPELVAQIGFTEWTRDGRLRHPRFLGLRRDKAARAVVRERPTGATR
ncbi:non-homologous end-joining DNA ligase [Rugosimonospora acidiphila]|uniref:DNA ligase (ATP) n=1 Tax=Rugosimonospora acidiphila TaxID=556531 RepID=A0ABP9SUW9_9ACTN